MKSIALLEKPEFRDKNPFAEPLYVSEEARVLRFALKPGQVVREHTAPHSPVFICVLRGQGMFAGADEHEQPFGPNSLIVFEAGENHSIRALNEDLIFLTFLREAPLAKSTETHKVGARHRK